MMEFLNNSVLRFILRRLFEGGSVMGLIASLDPRALDIIGRILAGDWDNVSITAVVFLITYIANFIWTWKASLGDQVVSNNTKVPLAEVAPSVKTAVKAEVAQAHKVK